MARAPPPYSPLLGVAAVDALRSGPIMLYAMLGTLVSIFIGGLLLWTFVVVGAIPTRFTFNEVPTASPSAPPPYPHP